MKKQIRIESIEIKHIADDSPDLSWLESKVENGIVDSCQYTQEEYDKNHKQVRDYIARDTNRLANYGISWDMIGIQAVAEVSYLEGISGQTRRLETFTSGGLWGIESDSDAAYIKEIEQAQLNDLKEHLEVFGINVSDFNSKIK